MYQPQVTETHFIDGSNSFHHTFDIALKKKEHEWLCVCMLGVPNTKTVASSHR